MTDELVVECTAVIVPQSSRNRDLWLRRSCRNYLLIPSKGKRNVRAQSKGEKTPEDVRRVEGGTCQKGGNDIPVIGRGRTQMHRDVPEATQ